MKKFLFFPLLLLSCSLLYADSISVTGKKALSYPVAWQEAQTEHFIYYFSDASKAETIMIHAETYYEWIKKFFGVDQDTWTEKSPIYVFEDEALWKQFIQESGPLLEGSAFTTGYELFVYRDPNWLAPMKTIAHELTHVILFRFLKGPVPLFLNEGFAEYVSYKAIATQFDGNEYNVHTVKKMSEDQWIPLEVLITQTKYPDGKEKVAAFYRESELFVRYLLSLKTSAVFFDFLNKLDEGKDIRDALKELYNLDFDSLEEAFREYALKPPST